MQIYILLPIRLYISCSLFIAFLLKTWSPDKQPNARLQAKPMYSIANNVF